MHRPSWKDQSAFAMSVILKFALFVVSVFSRSTYFYYSCSILTEMPDRPNAIKLIEGTADLIRAKSSIAWLYAAVAQRVSTPLKVDAVVYVAISSHAKRAGTELNKYSSGTVIPLISHFIPVLKYHYTLSFDGQKRIMPLQTYWHYHRCYFTGHEPL